MSDYGSFSRKGQSPSDDPQAASWVPASDGEVPDVASDATPQPRPFTFPSFESTDAASVNQGAPEQARVDQQPPVSSEVPQLTQEYGATSPPYGPGDFSPPQQYLPPPPPNGGYWVPVGTPWQPGFGMGGVPGGYGPSNGGYWIPSGAEPPSKPPSGKKSRGLVLAVAGITLVAAGLGAGLGLAYSGQGFQSADGPGLTNPAGNSPNGNSGPTGNSLAPQSSAQTNQVQRIANEVEPSVVDINTVIASETPGSTQAAGTGMIVSSSGLVLTNNHVIRQATEIRVTVEGYKGTYKASVVGEDPVHDVAVIQIHGLSGLPVVHFGNSSNVQLGEGVVAIGNALGQGGTPTVVTGSVSALGRTIMASDSLASGTETLHGTIQTTAPIQPGDSGGPLVNTNGQVIGMDTAAASADTGTTLGYAVPINRARSIASNIEHGNAGNGVVIGDAPFLGIFVSNVNAGASPSSQLPFPSPFGSPGSTGTTNSGSANAAGVQISGVLSNGPAAQAGIAQGDVITAINGKSIATFNDLHNEIAKFKPGNTISITYTSPNGSSAVTSVTLAGLPS